MRKIQIQHAGSHYKARFAGCNGFCFGATPQEARSRLEFWEQFYFAQKASKRVLREKAA